MDSRAVRVSHRAAALRGVKPAHESDLWLARFLLFHFNPGSFTAKSLGLYRPGHHLLYHRVFVVPAALAGKSRRLALADARGAVPRFCARHQAQWTGCRPGAESVVRFNPGEAAARKFAPQLR